MYRPSGIRYPVSCILYPVSGIRYPVSGILPPVSGIRYPVSCLLPPASCLLSPRLTIFPYLCTMRKILSWLFTATGWKVKGDFPRELNKYIVIVAPHTSNWDFLVGILGRAHLRMSHAKYLGKDSLFKPPFGWIFYALGGYPVDRSRHNNMVDSAAQIFEDLDRFVLALAPEGTRGKVERLKTGFWYIAQKAKVPIVMCGFDYATKTIKLAEPIYTSTIEEDMPRFLEFFRGIKGKVPENGITESTGQ